MSKLNSVEEYLDGILANVKTEDLKEVLTEVVHRTAELARKEQNEKAYKWLLDAVFCPLDAPDCDCHLHSGWFHDFKKAMEE